MAAVRRMLGVLTQEAVFANTPPDKLPTLSYLEQDFLDKRHTKATLCLLRAVFTSNEER